MAGGPKPWLWILLLVTIPWVSINSVTPSVSSPPQSLVQSRKAGITSALASSTLNNEELVRGVPPPPLVVRWAGLGAPGGRGGGYGRDRHYSLQRPIAQHRVNTLFTQEPVGVAEGLELDYTLHRMRVSQDSTPR